MKQRGPRGAAGGQSRSSRAANSGFIPSRVKQWIHLVRDFSDSVPRQVIAAVKHARTTSELVALIQDD